jgi:CheY-specific phosphatase CheX
MTMQAIDFDEWLETSVGEVLESMCFLSIIANAPTTESSGADWLSCSLQFTGDPSGYFGVSAPWSTARLIAANFLGEEEQDLSEQQTVEVICEVTNMACGAVLAHLDPTHTFSLSSPLRDLPFTERTRAEDGISRSFELDEGMVDAWLEIGPCS